MIRDLATAAGMTTSAWVTTAATEKAAREQALLDGCQAADELVAEYEAEHGPIPAEAKEFADQVLAELGLTESQVRKAG